MDMLTMWTPCCTNQLVALIISSSLAASARYSVESGAKS